MPPATNSTEPDDSGLTLALVEERLSLFSGPLVAEVHDRLSALLDQENARTSILESKASGLAAINGLTATAAFSFGGTTLLSHPEYFASVPESVYHLGGGLLIATVGVGLASGVWALRVVRVITQKTVDDNDVLNEEILSTADVCAKNARYETRDARAKDARFEAQEDGVCSYRRYMAAHIWAVTRAVEETNNKKARILLCAQSLFLASVSGISLLGILVGIVVMTRHPQAERAAPPPCAGAVVSADAGTLGSSTPPGALAAADAGVRAADGGAWLAIASDAAMP